MVTRRRANTKKPRMTRQRAVGDYLSRVFGGKPTKRAEQRLERMNKNAKKRKR